jgi:ABC-type sugar transport system substrate-binding protein
MTRRSFTVAVLLGAAIVVPAGANSPVALAQGTGGLTHAAPATGRIAAMIKDLDNPYFGAMEQGLVAEGKALHIPVTVQAVSSITDTTGQADKMAALAEQNYSCYIANPISATNLIQPLVTVARKHVPIVNIDNPIDLKAATAAGVHIATYIGTLNIDAGRLAGQEMAKLLHGKGLVARIGGIPGDITSQQRLQGFAQGLAGTRVKIVQTVAANWERPQALTAATDILRAHPSLAGFFSANDDMGLGVARAIAEAGKTGKVQVVSVDGILDALKAIEAHTYSATVSQYPYADGVMAVEACDALMHGKTVPSNVPAPIALITPANAATAIRDYPRPFVPYRDPFKSLIAY